jgi:anti-sigma B factor antagonist
VQQFSERQIDGVAVVSAVGAIDMLTAPKLQSLIDEVVARRPSGLVVDMSEVDFLGSAGMQVLMVTRNRLQDGTRLGVVADGPATSRPLKITGVSDYVELFPSLDVALTNFSA